LALRALFCQIPATSVPVPDSIGEFEVKPRLVDWDIVFSRKAPDLSGASGIQRNG
jgi:hypothetical protein